MEGDRSFEGSGKEVMLSNMILLDASEDVCSIWETDWDETGVNEENYGNEAGVDDEKYDKQLRRNYSERIQLVY